MNNDWMNWHVIAVSVALLMSPLVGEGPVLWTLMAGAGAGIVHFVVTLVKGR